MNAFPIGAVALALCFCLPLVVAAPLPTGEGYVARQESLRTFFEALSAALGKPIITSKSAGKRTVTGDFSLAAPGRTLERVTRQMGLIRYDDGQSVYIYEAAESKSAVISLNTITVAKLESFLRRSGLEDKRFPLRNDGARTLYVSGPPIYVDLAIQAAHYMDTQSADRRAQGLHPDRVWQGLPPDLQGRGACHALPGRWRGCCQPWAGRRSISGAIGAGRPQPIVVVRAGWRVDQPGVGRPGTVPVAAQASGAGAGAGTAVATGAATVQ